MGLLNKIKERRLAIAVAESKEILSRIYCSVSKEYYEAISAKITEVCERECGYVKNKEYCKSIKERIDERLPFSESGSMEISKYDFSKVIGNIMCSERDKVRYDEFNTYVKYTNVLTHSLFPRITKEEVKVGAKICRCLTKERKMDLMKNAW